MSPHFADENGSSSKRRTLSLTLVKFDAKGDRKENNSHTIKKHKEMSILRECIINSSMHTCNLKSTGLFSISMGIKIQKRVKQ